MNEPSRRPNRLLPALAVCFVATVVFAVRSPVPSPGVPETAIGASIPLTPPTYLPSVTTSVVPSTTTKPEQVSVPSPPATTHVTRSDATHSSPPATTQAPPPTTAMVPSTTTQPLVVSTRPVAEPAETGDTATSVTMYTTFYVVPGVPPGWHQGTALPQLRNISIPGCTVTAVIVIGTLAVQVAPGCTTAGGTAERVFDKDDGAVSGQYFTVGLVGA